MSFIPPTDDQSPHKGRAALALLFGLVSSRSGATGLLAQGRGERPSLSRPELEATLVALFSCIAFLIEGLVGWRQMQSLEGVVIGLVVGAIVTLVGGVAWSIYSMIRKVH